MKTPVLRARVLSLWACERWRSPRLRGPAWVPRSIVLDEIEKGKLLVLNEISPPIPMQVVAHLSRITDGAAITKLREIL